MDSLPGKQARLSGSHAVVIGGSMAGLMAAKVLADHFAQVTVVERDHLPLGPEVRQGAPQARHAHALLARGEQVMADLFPGLAADLEEHGAVRVDPSRDFRWYHHGIWRARFDSGMSAICMSRPLLEWRVRTHLLAQPKIRLMEDRSVTELLTSTDRTRITGVRLDQEAGGVRELEADLVIDAAGRGSRAPQWLESLGYSKVEESAIKVNLGYGTRVYRRPSRDVGFQGLLQVAKPPTKRSGVMLPMEGDQWMLTLYGYFGDHPPSDEEGFLGYVRSLPVPDLFETIRNLEPASPVATYKVPSSLRRHYERLPRFPEGYAVLGDAACSFNPVFGQGMTTAALGALTLAQSLQHQAETSGKVDGLAASFQKKLAKVIDLPWQAVSSEDFRFKETTGPRAPGASIMNWYIGRIHQLTARDQDIMVRFLQVQQMLKPPTALFNLRTVLKVLAGA